MNMNEYMILNFDALGGVQRANALFRVDIF